MNVPAVAQKTFDDLKKEPKYLSLVQLILKKLSKIHQPIKRAEYIHRMVDEVTEKIFSEPVIKKLSPCQQGCSACCHTQVSVTQEEAELLALRVEEGIKIDESLLMKQIHAKNDSTAYYQMPYGDRKCVFLDEKGSCKAYQDRPSVCRTNAVIGESSQCDTSAEIKPTRLVKTPEADLVVYASFLESKSSGALPYMLARALKKIDH